MSSASVPSVSPSKGENALSEFESLSQELESIRAMNSSLRAYLAHLRGFKRNIAAVNDNCIQLSKVNSQWIDTINNMK